MIVNWIDIVLVLLLISNIYKGYSLGLILSMFNLLQFLMSYMMTKAYFYPVFVYIRNNDYIYGIFEKIVFNIMNVFLKKKLATDSSYVNKLMARGVVDLVVIFFSILLVYKIANILMEIFFSLFSFLLDIRFFRILNKYGGVFFGLFKGLCIIYLFNTIVNIVDGLDPNMYMPKVLKESFILNKIDYIFMLIKEGDIIEKTRLVLWNLANIIRSVGSTVKSKLNFS